MTDINEVKKLLGEKRLALLAQMPRVIEVYGGLDNHLQNVCKFCATPQSAVIRVLILAGSHPTKEDEQAAAQALGNTNTTANEVAKADVSEAVVAESAAPAESEAAPAAESDKQTKPKKR